MTAQASDGTLGPARRLRVLVLVASLVLALVAGGLLALELRDRHIVRDRSRSISSAAAVHSKVMEVATQFLLRKETFGPQDLDSDGQLTAYQDRVHQVITPKLAVDFDKSLEVAAALVKQQGLTSTSTVYATGVSSSDSDSAAVLVSGGTTIKFQSQAAKISVYRDLVKLVKIHGTWLVDSYEEIPPPAPGAESQP